MNANLSIFHKFMKKLIFIFTIIIKLIIYIFHLNSYNCIIVVLKKINRYNKINYNKITKL